MYPFLEVLSMLLQTFFMFLVHPVFWMVMALVFFQYHRIAQMEEKLFGYPINNIFKQTIRALLLGIIGGLAASCIFVLLGLSLDRIGIAFIWPVAILLLLINPRYLCFAYAGGIVSVGVFVAHYLINIFPALEENYVISSLADVYLPGLLVVVAVLHLMESLLIYIGGHWGSSPVYYKGSSGEVLGGFSLQCFWPMPLVGMIALARSEIEELTNGAMDMTISMPEWWPILQSGIEPIGLEEISFLMLPVMAALGYADLAVSSSPSEKTKISARFLSIYSLLLLILALAAEFHPIMLAPACLFAPLGHELVVYLGNKFEFKQEPRYRAPENGVKILAVYPESPAERAGLQKEDIILRINNVLVENSYHFWQLIGSSYFLTHLTVKREEEIITLALQQEKEKFSSRLVEAKKSPPRRYPPLGLILVPDLHAPVYLELKKQAPAQKLRNLWRRK